MYSKLALFVASAFALSALAAPGAEPTVSQCNVGTMNCCNTVQDADHKDVQTAAGLLGILLGDVTGQVGLGCTSAGVLGVAGNSCTAQPVCCTGNDFRGAIVLGCSPINVNL